ncbi:MAG: peptidase [Alphaproteobacteria bacterium]|jgi:Zn-dependent protease|nr:peptidase [Alphaproteobacteria bacterium]
MSSQTGLETIAFLIALMLAITFHEAAHGFVARLFGDQTATRLGRVTLNPFKHIDPFGTLLLPGFMLLSGTPFLFGYAKPVPVNFHSLTPKRLGMISVAAAGPGMNFLLAWLSALLLHINIGAVTLGNEILINSIRFNIVLAIFNMLPLPPLDGGRVMVGLLPKPLSQVFARIEPYGFLILLGLLILPDLVLQPLTGIRFNPLREIMVPAITALTHVVLALSGHSS